MLLFLGVFGVDSLDKQILMELQYNFPLSVRPYELMAQKLGVEVEELWDRIINLLDSGIIRRMGASLDSNKLGFCSTLAAVSVEPEVVEQASEVIGRFSEVTHSYLRKDDFNIWFTIIAAEQERIDYILEEIRSLLLLASSQILNLPKKSLFKLDGRFI